jgi:hypothetical protein
LPRLTALASALYRISFTSVLLPDPEQRHGPRRLPPLLGWLYAPAPGEKLACHGPLLGLYVLDAADGDYLTTVYPGSGADVDDVVRVAYGLLVMLDDDERVAEVAQFFEGGQEPAVVPLVQPDGGLVQHVEDAHEPAPDLRGEPDPLRLASRQRSRRAAEGEVPQPHVDEEPETLADLLHHALADDPLPRGELHVVEEALRVRYGELRELVDVLAPDRDGQGLRPEPGALALWAGNVAHELLDLLPPVLRIGLGVAPLQVTDHAVEAGHVLPPPVVAVAVRDVDAISVGAEQDKVPVLLGQVAPGNVHVYTVLLGQRAEHARVVLGLRVGPRHHGPLVDAQVLVGYDERRVYLQPAPESVAAVAGPMRAVERERARLYLRD